MKTLVGLLCGILTIACPAMGAGAATASALLVETAQLAARLDEANLRAGARIGTVDEIGQVLMNADVIMDY